MDDKRIKMKINDEKGRRLFAIMTEKDGTASWVFHRYPDMSDIEKELLRALHERLVQLEKNPVCIEDGVRKPLGDIDPFLNYEEGDELCG